MTAYRNDVDALAARDEVLTRELADKQRELESVQRMLVEARAAEAAEAKAHNVMVGRRRVHRVLMSLGVLALAAGAAGVMCVSEGPDMVPSCTDCTKTESPDEARFTAVLAGKGYARIDLEPRYPTLGGVETQAELHTAVGEAVEPWQQFLYTRDATVRAAIASNIYKAGEPEPFPEFATDGNGGVWRIVREEPLPAVAAPTGTGWTRKVWLLPAGTSYRGDLRVANPR
jgi:hypothetical protein